MDKLTEFASSLFLFRGIDSKKTEILLKKIKPEVRSYQRTEMIYTPTEFLKKVGFVISGKCEVRRPDSCGRRVTINTLSTGDSFGILAIFGEAERFPTEIYATKNTSVMFIEKEDVLSLIRQSGDVAINIITFMSTRISFLNEKIATYSGTTVEMKLASHILSRYEKSSSLEFPFNCKHCSEAISAGRASVYRALLLLEKEGLIKHEDKKIVILDLKGLERISK